MLHSIYHALAWNWGGDGWGGGNAPGYLIHSGPLANLALLSAAATWLVHRNCGVHGCWFLGRAGYGHRCRKHRLAPQPAVVHTHVHLDGRKIAESIQRRPNGV